MELPIQVMITMFVALTVAVVVIMFSQNLLQDAAKDIADIGDYGDTPEDKIVEVGTITSTQVANLVNQCYRQYSESALGDTLCYVVLGKVEVTADAVISSSGLPEGKISINLEGAQNALQIYYVIIGDKVEVRP
ncbi:MAG: hypothetical protein JXB14_02810 [Candidatus Altiarchaeota archaeon]|nr:hypothetical protein [Candidatus Altiarchaeota archaeon]